MRIDLQWLIVAVAAGLLTLAPACKKGGSSTAPAQLYATSSCANCHGDSRQGKPNLGPALTDIKQHWSSADELAKYLASPRDYALGNQRLRENMGKYSMKMPTITLTDEERQALARWLLQ